MANSLIGFESDQYLFMKTDVARKLDSKSLTRFYVAFFNWNYLSTIYIYSKHSSRSDDSIPLEKEFPADVWRILRKNRFYENEQRPQFSKS